MMKAGLGTRQEQTPAAEATQLLAGLRAAVASGRKHWFIALLEAVGQWRLPEETIGERTYRYLIGGEAFDWLLLAERLCLALEDLIPPEECEALLFHNRPPLPIGQDEFRCFIGSAKYRAHLNYVYGVLVEEALQLAVEEEVHKERWCRVWDNHQREDEVFLRIYGQPRLELLRAYRQEQSLPWNGRLLVGELKGFTYWLFKYRLHHCDPAKVASDTRKGMARLARLERAHQPFSPDGRQAG